MTITVSQRTEIDGKVIERSLTAEIYDGPEFEYTPIGKKEREFAVQLFKALNEELPQ